MKKSYRKWTSLLVVLSMLMSLFPALTAYAATSRITINGLFISESQPDLKEPLVTRLTTNPISLPVTIENISDNQIPNLYYEITNVSMGGSPVADKSNKAQKTSQYDVVFNNVLLTEGLNKITVKLGDTSVVSSAPAWVYYTPTTNLETINVNGVPFQDGKMYPENPQQSTMLNISGTAPNATEVKAYLYGDPVAKNAFFSNGSYFFLADDINKPSSTAAFRLRPGDNPLTIMAVNNSRTYEIQKNLIYDNGKPFAFNAKIGELENDGTPVKDGSGNVIPPQDLIKTPTVTKPKAQISAYLKDDLTALGDLQYKFVEVMVGGQRFGPYNLDGANAAPRVFSLNTNVLYEGYSATDLFVTGQALSSSALLTLKAKDGTAVLSDAAPIALNSGNTVAAYRIPAGLLIADDSPYTVEVKVGSSLIHDSVLTLAVNAPTGITTLPGLNGNAIISPIPPGSTACPTAPTPCGDYVKAGTAPAPASFTISTAPDPAGNTYGMQITTVQNAPVATLTGTGAGPVSFPMPTIQNEGMYKYRITYAGVTVMERAFTVGKKDPTPPSLSINGPRVLSHAGAVAGFSTTNPTTLYFSGANLGTNASDIQNPRLVAGATTIALEVVEVKDTSILLKIPNQSALNPLTNYQLAFDKRLRYPDGSLGSTVPYSSGATVAESVYASSTTGTIAITGVTIPQMLPSEVNTTTFTVTGVGIDPSNLTLTVTNEDGSNPRNAANVAAGATSTQMNANFSTIPGLIAGGYMLKVINKTTNEVLGQYPFVVVDPALSGFTEVGGDLQAIGTNFGRDVNLLKLRFSLNDNPAQFVEQTAQSIEAGRRATFDIPNGLSNGAYTLTLLYNDTAVGNPFPYNVSAAATTLNEVAAWSKTNRYKVFDFSAKLDIPTDKVQVVEFRFFNSSNDVVPPTSFTFNYVDPNLPYIESTKRSDGMQLIEGGRNDITELPSELTITTDLKTAKVNVYVGDYTSSTPIATSLDQFVLNADGTKRLFKYSIPGTFNNGITKVTFIPSTNATPMSKAGENYSGRRQYDLTISNTPYLIVNNIYHGRVVKNPNLEITCVKPLESIATGSCISGKLVNIPIPLGNPYSVEVIVNDSKTNTLVAESDFKTFYVQVGNFVEGKNTIKFNVIKNGQIVTSSSYELFVFSTDAPEFLSIKPVETTDVPKFVLGSQAETYSTNETSVSFSGQFANASEIKLTVRSKDDNGVPVVKYDRRYNNFTSAEPLSANPNFFKRLNSPSAGQFETNPITLATKGETIFEFSITNASGITVMRTITISREPLPFVIKYPTLITNEKGELQANINSNYIEIEMEAEGADSVVFGKDMAVQREVIDENSVKRKRFFYEVDDLKAGKNSIRFTVNRGTQKTNGTFVLYNVDTPVEGAQYKSALKSSIDAFDGKVKLVFPKGTNFIRNEPGAVNQFLTADRKILFGIASQADGRVDKYRHPSVTDGQPPKFPYADTRIGAQYLSEPSGRFRPAGPLIWIDAGSIRKNETDMNKALSGSGRLPYDNETFYSRSKEDQVVPTERGTLTLKYDSIIRDDAWKYVSVYHFDIYEDYTGTTQWRWRNLGGVINTSNNTITVPFDTFGYYQVMYMGSSYDDVTGHPWARNELDTLYSKGLMLNKEASAFVPNDAITRGEFATMLVKIFDIPLQYTEQPTFTDVPRVNILTRLYDYKYIETAAKAGIVRGAALGRFLPDSAITRQDAAVMIARAADLKLASDSTLDKVLANLQKSFTDAEQIDIYARSSVEAVTKAGLIEGKENVLQQGQTKATVRFDPLNTFTRAEAAVVAMRVLQQQKKVPK